MHEIIQLSDDLIIGKGRDRVCYIHPHNEDLCIKISIGNNKQSEREARYFNFLESRQTDLSKISIFQENVITNLGKGYTFDLIKDEDGNVAKTLRQCLELKILTLDEIKPKLRDLKDYLVRNNICVRDMTTANIICKKTKGGFKLFIIDGVSNASINPLTIRFHSLVRKAIEKA
jgi:hypothetical protein